MNDRMFIFETERPPANDKFFLSIERPPANDIMYIFETKRSEKYNVQIPYLPILKWNFSFLLTNSCGQGR